MIVIDIETSGNLFPEKNGIWQIGAVEIENPENYFLEEARIDDEDEIENISLVTSGKTNDYFRDQNKQSQKDMLKKLFKWANQIKSRNIICQNTPFDYGFLWARTKKYDLKFPFPTKTFDLHGIAQLRYFQIKGEFLIKEGESRMNLTNVLNFCGIKDKRRKTKEGKIVKEGNPHNALEDAKLEAECFSRLVYSKSLFPEYSKFKIPEELLK